jgi:hypothetical protein
MKVHEPYDSYNYTELLGLSCSVEITPMSASTISMMSAILLRRQVAGDPDEIITARRRGENGAPFLARLRISTPTG